MTAFRLNAVSVAGGRDVDVQELTPGGTMVPASVLYQGVASACAPLSAANPLPLRLTDGATFYQAALESTAQGILAALQGTLTVSGALTISGTVDATGSTVAVSSLPAVTFASPQHVIVDSATLGTVTVTGTVAATQSGTWSLGASSAVIGHVVVDSGTFTNANLDVALSTRASQATVAAILSALGGGLPLALGASGGLKIDGSGTALPVNGTVTANIGTSGSLALDATLTNGSQRVGGTVAISNANVDAAGALATSALQTTGNTSLSTIATNTGRIPTLGQAVAGSSSPVVLPSAQDVVAYAGSGNAIKIVGADGSAVSSLANGVPVQPGTSTTWNVADRLTRLLGLLTGKDGTNVASASNGLPVAPETSSVWDVSSRAARLIGAISGSNGSGVASPSNPLDVQPGTSVTWNVSDRAARLLGALTGINGTSVATGANPVPMQLSSGSAVIAVGPQASATAIPTVQGFALAAEGSSLPTTGTLIKNGLGTSLQIVFKNSSGGTVFFQIHNTTTTPAGGAKPLWWSAAGIATGSAGSSQTGTTMYGTPCSTAVYLVASSTDVTYTAIASTSIVWTLIYL